ncbi:FAD/NAD(P)-binding domain-containing protein [Mycena kentingensis (nom. inval.)]|nr:FAD/NAD(P)-binding domain-containing protein [Mycena kentingensis (nom. inval.)]
MTSANDTPPVFPGSPLVCIVGAGPSGLACALGLAKRNVPFVIVDALEEGHGGSRSVMMHAAALETIADVDAALVDRIVARGIRSKFISAINTQGRPIFDISAAPLIGHTRYPFWLLVPQHYVESQMREWLRQRGQLVLWKKRVAGVLDVEEGFEVRFDSGEVLNARYVVAADGCRSTVRAAAGIRFLHPQTRGEVAQKPISWVVADVLIQSPLPGNLRLDRLQITMSGGASYITSPLPAHFPAANAARLYLGIPDGAPPSFELLDADYIQRVLDSRPTYNAAPKIKSVLHASRYRTTFALAETFFYPNVRESGYILLVGDAAHQMGAAGGQGLNLGICDGCALAERIENAWRGDVQAQARLFAGYSTRRREIAREVITMVEDMTRMEESGQDWKSYFRIAVLWAMLKVPWVNASVAWKLSGLGYR